MFKHCSKAETEEVVRGKSVVHDVTEGKMYGKRTKGRKRKEEQALALGLWVQWPGGPVDLKTYWPPQKSTGPPKNKKYLRKPTI